MNNIERRQIWAQPTSTTLVHPSCTPFLLPSNGVLIINSSFSVTMTEDAYYQPTCTGAGNDGVFPSAMLNNADPFYASVGPQLYAIGCMTVVSYLLVIILLITPRKFYIGGPGGDGNILGRHGIISGSYSGHSSVTGVGGRPWLQKVAALLVAISLTIATVDSFRVAERQYDMGYTDAAALTEEVIDGTEIRAVHVVSSTFLWLAQVQTLIRLFPRHKEKVMIKWAGFALIVLDTIFAILDNFLSHGSETRPRLFDDAIPALSYLFELALNLLYAAWVIFYSLSKHRFAFFHPKMRNICLVAIFSLCAVLIPVVFFIMDISSPDVAGWGEYIRWVGSAAASVVVWEWVERIEALERDERKGGILGREIFDGDEMLEVTPSQEVEWPRSSNAPGNKGGRGTGAAWRGSSTPNNRVMRRGHLGFQLGTRNRNDADNEEPHRRAAPAQDASAPPVPPPAAVTPISRADTTSAASTVYFVRYHTVASPTPPLSAPPVESSGDPDPQNKQEDIHGTAVAASEAHPTGHYAPVGNEILLTAASGWRRWLPGASLFGARRTSPPQEIATAQEEEENARDKYSESDDDNFAEKDVSPSNKPSRFQQALSSFRLGELQQRFGTRSPKPLTVTVIPSRDIAHQRWSPQANEVERSSHLANSNGLPTTVIPAQGRRTSAWPSPSNTSDEHGNNDQLQYDPETAALVGVEPDYVTQPTRTVSVDSSTLDASDTPDERANNHSSGHQQMHRTYAEGETRREDHPTSRETLQFDYDDGDIEAGRGRGYQ
ncbi:pH signal transduction protein PalH [Talaromyces stipitatus ATCC 10500]|uniref:pH signal transduction protein PalH n=1 Tax=Talaromyces stipitatus (strain ATCC 10500 / CBS 375.48 / QM 6759 / NRRL 1006) TaxID=441959 RepID=B8LYD9_TALSN|nr:pH signal transduction protein PalH [Talaromyces stipitatus ATCC 10500]EED22868.1 pH signal transduction protein PalH [Talaromyces stipitatus ATCC 10500]